MATNVLNARVQLRYDTYAHWMNSDLILLEGELAIASMPNRYTIALSNSQPENTPPAIGIKVGDGFNYFADLPWVQAIAADVYNWAKTSKKPTYTAEEISGLATYIEQHGGGSSGVSGSSYRLTYDQVNNKYILQYYDDSTEEWQDTTSEVDFNGILNRIATIENWANGSYNDIGNIELPLAAFISDQVVNVVGRLNVVDSAVDHQFVTSVSEKSGKIIVTRKALTAEDITSGVLPVERGGTGFASVGENEILIGSSSGVLQKTGIAQTISEDYEQYIPTSSAVMDYVAKETAGLTGAMHFIGEASAPISNNSRVNPQISGYKFAQALPGDVVLYDAKEFVWTGLQWRLLGDEGSYAIKGSITNVDIADEANIAISKIANLQDKLDEKVDVVDGKQLSTNDYTDEDKLKLSSVEERAQVNVIEHVFLNDNELIPTTIDGLAKSIKLSLLTLTQAQIDKLDGIEEGAQKNLIEHIILNGSEILPTTIENLTNAIALDIKEFDSTSQEKLADIEAGAEKNKIEKIIYDGEELAPDENRIVTITPDPHTDHINKIEQIFINEVEWVPNKDKQVKIVLDQSALNLNVLEGATVPSNAGGRVDVEQQSKKLLLERIAVSGDVAHLKQTTDTYIILDCGDSTTVV